jgi:hypothetical protein
MSEIKAVDQIMGIHAEFELDDNKYHINNLFSGLYLRNAIAGQTDAMIIVAGLNVYNVNVGINYDINVSGLKDASNFRGAFEISIIYESISTVFDMFTIPCERI